MALASRLSCGSTTMKYILFIFNFFFVACGIALIALGAIPLAKQSLTDSFSKTNLILVIVVGSVIFLVSFLGCWGAYQENRIMLLMFGIILLILLLLQIALVTLAFIGIGRVYIDTALRDVFLSAQGNSTTATSTVDSIQSTFSCCGISGPEFWVYPPLSCCSSDQQSGSYCTQPYETGCMTAVRQFLQEFIFICGVIGLVVAVIEMVGIWFSFSLARSYKMLEKVGFSPVPTSNPVVQAEAVQE